jgi:hypothetical protein
MVPQQPSVVDQAPHGVDAAYRRLLSAARWGTEEEVRDISRDLWPEVCESIIGRAYADLDYGKRLIAALRRLIAIVEARRGSLS